MAHYEWVHYTMGDECLISEPVPTAVNSVRSDLTLTHRQDWKIIILVSILLLAISILIYKYKPRRT